MDHSKAESENKKEEINKEEPDDSSPLKSNPEEPEKVKKNEEEKKKLTFKERIKLIKENVSVEPIVLCYVIPAMLTTLAIQNLNLEKACRINLNYSTEVCDALNSRQTENYTLEEEEVQKVTASVTLWKNIVQTVFPVIIMLFVGAWSDKTGKRKAIIMLPIVGEVLSCLGLILNTYFFSLPIQVLAFAEVIFAAIVGGGYTNSIGVYSYIGDITNDEDRTFRMGLVTTCSYIGYPIGSALSGVLFAWMGYYGVFAVALAFHLFNLIYGYTYLKEPRQRAEKKIEIKKHEKKCFLREFFDVSLVSDTFMVAFRKGPGNRRLLICLLLIVMCVIYGPMSGEGTIMYLFTRYKFHWDDVQYSMWSTYVIVTNMAGTFFSVTLFSNYMKLDDALLGLISNMSKICAAFVYAFASTTWQIYLAPAIDMLSGISFIAIQSISTKLVDGEEFGKLNSLFGLVEATVPLIYGPLYSRVYMATINIFPGTVYILGASLTLPAFAIFGWLYYQHKKEKIINGTRVEDSEMQQDEK
ncbi:hypothetical protein PYW08_014996 [Mythimna loreyi]|uniref:Uncharacterized protein n=1 Tax=Mythimna loreyi TaxID=667449 RepID=A0ACC2R3P6_9NEOP|nr:hypothetical protein PYW08_014996 [Mythimna loreyi]